MKIDRLIGILSILLQEEKTTAPELAERFEVSRRTINRDIEDLCKAGIPIKTAQGTGGGISIMDGYRMDRTILSSKDMQMILAGLRSLDSVSGSRYYSQLMEKIQTGSSEFISGRDSMLIDLSSWYKGSLAPKIEVIQSAIENRRIIRFKYYAPSGESNRRVEPYYLVFRWSSWYVWGWCLERKDYRLFKLNRMDELPQNWTYPLIQPKLIEKYLQIEKQSYSRIQLAAKQTIEYIKKIIKPGMNLLEIRKFCEEKLLELGADSFWYWDVGAFVFAGDETTVSVSGKQYVTSDRIIGNNDIITIDLSPQVGNIWGDYARTFIVENGMVVEDIGLIENPEWKSGLQMEEKLHIELLRFATKETTFEELYYHMNKYIVENGFVNLDFMGNLGHSIVKTKGDRVYIEKGNVTKLGDVKYFTFEPHISFPDSKYGYKKENIYYFDENGLMEL